MLHLLLSQGTTVLSDGRLRCASNIERTTFLLRRILQAALRLSLLSVIVVLCQSTRLYHIVLRGLDVHALHSSFFRAIIIHFESDTFALLAGDLSYGRAANCSCLNEW